MWWRWGVRDKKREKLRGGESEYAEREEGGVLGSGLGCGRRLEVSGEGVVLARDGEWELIDWGVYEWFCLEAE